MKQLIYTIALTLACSFASASGKFIFKPEHNYTKKTDQVEIGVAIHQKVVGPIYWTNWTGGSYSDNAGKDAKEFQNFSFKNGLMIQPLAKLQVEVGHEYSKDLKSTYNENVGYLKIAAQMW